jgi:hypothetical protein
MRVIFADKTAKGPASTERLINLYGVAAPEGGRSSVYLAAMPGTRNFSSLPGVFLRAMTEIDGSLYSASGGNFCRINESGSYSQIATIADDPHTSIAGFRNYVGVCAGGVYQVWDGTTFVQPSGGRLATINSICYADRYVLLAGEREVEWTAVGDPTTRNGLNFREAEGRDDKIVRIVPVGSYVWILKERSYEVWASNPAATSEPGRWNRLSGVVRQRGLKAFNLVCRIPDGVFLIGNDGIAYIGGGTDLTPISTEAEDRAIAKGQPLSCFYYEWQGAKFACIRFGDRPALCFDLTTGRWAERSEGADHSPWKANFAAEAWGRWHLANARGNVYTLGAGTHDADGPLRRTAISRTADQDDRFRISRLSIRGEFGVGEVTEDRRDVLRDTNGIPVLTTAGDLIYLTTSPAVSQTRPVQLHARFCRDGKWGELHARSLGWLGQRGIACTFRSLGQVERTFAAEINITDPVDVTLYGEAAIEVR